MTRSFLAALTLALASTLLAGCGFFGDKLDPKKNWTVEEFYKNAREELDSGNYGGAVKAYEALEAKYPFGRYAQQSQLDIAYAYYKDGETAQAVSAADRFLKLHPNHIAADYALYIKALAYFKPDMRVFGELLNLDPAERDPKALRKSFEGCKDLVTIFPDTKSPDDSMRRYSFLLYP